MSTTESPIPSNCPELGIQVPICDIDKKLRQLWEQDDARTNASLMNLVVYSEQAGSLQKNSQIIQNLTTEHACRAILVEIDRNATDPSIHAWITAHCHLAHGRKSVCCEQIAFHLAGRVTGRFRNTVFAHLNSDLPLVFWWQGELSPVLTERLTAVVDRLIIDSSSWENPAESFRFLEKTSPPSLMLQDHAWARTWKFRLGVASVFDDPVAQQALPNIDSVEITYHPDHKNSALMILTWLANQAQWSDQHDASHYQYMSTSGNTIAVSLTEDNSGPALTSLTLRSDAILASVKLHPGSSNIERRIEAGSYHASSMSPADPIGDAELVASQLSRGSANSLFKKVLPRFRRLLE